jgi:hypothetical protein
MSNHCWHSNDNPNHPVPALPIWLRSENEICCRCGTTRIVRLKEFKAGENPEHGKYAPAATYRVYEGGDQPCKPE